MRSIYWIIIFWTLQVSNKLIYYSFLVTHNFLKFLKSKPIKENFESVLYLLLTSIKDKAEEYNKERIYNNLSVLQNYLTFFMILTINLKDFPDFIKTVFKGQLNFFSKLVEIIKKLKKKKQFLGIINNLFTDEYKEIYFKKSSDDLEQLFIEENTKFGEIFQDSFTKYEKETYIKLFAKLLKFDLSYQNFFSSHDKIDTGEIPAYKLNIAQSLIRVMFSREKKKYSNEKFYEYNLLKRVIDKDMEETYQKYGDEYKTLFRKEDICDDFLKYMFFAFGNTLMIESFVNPVKTILEKEGRSQSDITKDEFDYLVTELISKTKKHMPNVLKILLKLLYESVRKQFTIDADNYGPLYTTLIFNFFISPRLQMMYDINSLNKDFIRSLNRLLRNSCFNFKFAQEDTLSSFNDSVEKNHLKIKKFIKEEIIGINIGDDNVKGSLGDIFTEKYLIYPNFLFYLDSHILCESSQGGVNEFIEYEELKVGK